MLQPETNAMLEGNYTLLKERERKTETRKRLCTDGREEAGGQALAHRSAATAAKPSKQYLQEL